MVAGRVVCIIVGVASILLGPLRPMVSGGVARSAAPAPRDPVESPARPLHEAAMTAFHDGRFEFALELERKAQALEPSPVFLYQIGRAQEALGMLREAYQSYVTARANLDGHPHASADLAELIARAIDGLAELRERAVLRIGERVAHGATQVDAAAVPDDVDDVVLAPGPHQVCFAHLQARWSACLEREIGLGVRVAVSAPTSHEALGALLVDASPRFSRARIDGHLLLVEPRGLDVVYLEPGTHEIALEREGGALDTITFELVAGDRRPLDVAPEVREVAAPPPASHLGPWITVGVGAALAGTAAVLFGLAAAERSDVEDASRNEAGQIAGLSQRAAFARWEHADRLDTWGWGVGAAGLGALIGGLVWLALDDDQPGAEQVAP